MSYELQKGKSLGESLRRICRKQIEAAIAITRGDEHEGESAVHETRKHLKRARAVLQLVRGEIGKGLYRQQDCALRDVGRLISELRDAEVRLQTLKQLERIGHRRRRSCENVEAMLAFELENFMAAFAGWQSQAAPMLEEALKGGECWAVGDFDGKQLAAAVQTSYRRARNALAEAQANPSAERFHEFRAKAKRLCFHLRVLQPVNAVVLKNLRAELGAVSKLLGQAHDLSFLGERLRDQQPQAQWRREAGELVGVLETGEGQLQRGAAELGEHFFIERPRDFGKKIAEWLENWEENKAPSVAEELI
jgi:CHAD domain-containing protein